MLRRERRRTERTEEEKEMNKSIEKEGGYICEERK
jgi:hypothetical protein